MDEALRALERELRATPGDRSLRRRYRAALARHSALDPRGAARRLDVLEGVYARPLALGPHADPDTGGGSGWRYLPAVLQGPPPGLPTAPTDPDLRELWRAEGKPVLVSAGLVLLEDPDGGLEARSAADGALLWAVPSERLEVDPSAEEEEERVDVLGWAATPWGAVALSARFEASLERRRVGRYTPRGRTTEREVVGRGATYVEVRLHLLVPDEGWSDVPPDALVEQAEGGEPLGDSDLRLEGWDDELLALSLDPRSRTFAVHWRDESQDWATFLVAGGGAGLSASVGAAGWTADEEPFQARVEAASPADDDLGGSLRLTADGRTLVHRDAAGAERRHALDADLAEPSLVDAEGGPLLLARRGPAVVVRRASAGGIAVDAAWDLAPFLEGREARSWRRGPGDPRRHAQVLASQGRLLVQLGDEALVVLG